MLHQYFIRLNYILIVVVGLSLLSWHAEVLTKNNKIKLLLKKWRLVEATFPAIEQELQVFSPSERKANKQKLKKLWQGSFIEFKADNRYYAYLLGDSTKGTWYIVNTQDTLLIRNEKDTATHKMPIVELTKNSLVLIGKEQQKFIWQPF